MVMEDDLVPVAEYRLTAKLPKALAQALPAPEELERLLSENT